MTLSRCQNCNKVWPDDTLGKPIPDLEERVSSGEPMPSGECPECRALCQELTTEEMKELEDALDDARETQTVYWNALRHVETLLGFDLDHFGDHDLEEYTLDDLFRKEEEEENAGRR